MSLIECVPNVSEGRRPEVLASFAAVIRAAGAALLDTTADAAHHRSVFTFAGDRPTLTRAVTALAEAVIAAVDLRDHRGVHPRLGALDVVPFVPLGATPMSECVALAREVGAAIATRFDLPVYLYEEAALHSGRQRLEDIRRGEFEGLEDKLRDPAWAPDFGPARRHPTAGATVVGARRFLIAFNVYLATSRVEVARAIAAAIRERDGGLPAVKALGLLVNGRAQVSMNLTDFTRTPPQVVVDRVRTLAAAHGVEAAESELIGLLPAAALAGTTPEHLGLPDFSTDRIVEERVRILNP